MRVVILGAGGLAVTTARILIERGHEVAIVERDKERIDALSDSLDCGFVHGDGTRPAILRELDPERTAFLLCLTGNDQVNLIGSLVGRHLGFRRTVTKIEEPEFEHICIELGLEDTIIPDRMIARSLAELIAGHHTPELSATIKGDVRFFSFVAREEEAMKVSDLELPAGTRMIGVSRGEGFLLLDEGSKLEKGDEVLLLTQGANLDDLRTRFGPKARNQED